jgi:hypothetical protein
MATHGTGTFAFSRWDEQPYSQAEGGAKVTHARVTNAYHGDIEGEGQLAYLMFYPDDRTATFVGLEQVIGRIGDRAGSFVLQHGGTFTDGAATCTWFVVPGSATGDLRGLHGEGGYVASHEQPTSFTLDYDFE